MPLPQLLLACPLPTAVKQSHFGRYEQATLRLLLLLLLAVAVAVAAAAGFSFLEAAF